jgi:indole-3-glycerol phosphate synthase
MPDILEQIVEYKKAELEKTKAAMPLSRLVDRVRSLPPTRNFKKAITAAPMTIIAEVKKASPSKGIMCPDFDPLKLAEAYDRNGAAAISVLTESQFFLGRLEYLEAIKAKVKIPLLRKDFILEPYQVFESRAAGADAMLLIAAILNENELARLLKLARETGLACLVEVHDETEVQKALRCGADIIGINNRDLKTFVTDIEVTLRLRSLLPAGVIAVSESGISGKTEIDLLKRCGVNAILIGEALVTADSPDARLKEMTKLLR